MHSTVCNYTLIYAHLNGIYQGWGVIATMNGIVYQPPWTFRPSCYARRSPIDTCLVSKKFYKSPLTHYVFGVAMGCLLLKLQNFKKVKLIFGHPVHNVKVIAWDNSNISKHLHMTRSLHYMFTLCFDWYQGNLKRNLPWQPSCHHVWRVNNCTSGFFHWLVHQAVSFSACCLSCAGLNRPCISVLAW